MFGNIGWGEMLVLVVAALVILGPERLPAAVQWTMRSLRQVRDYASGASHQLKQDFGPEIDEWREPLSQINRLRGMSARSVITQHLLDGDDSLFTGTFDAPTNGSGRSDGNGDTATGETMTPTQPTQKPLAAGERPPIDPDAT